MDRNEKLKELVVAGELYEKIGKIASNCATGTTEIMKKNS